MNKNILISLIIVTYNAEKHIGDLLESLVTRINNQSEVIVIDGLSNDNTIQIINKYQNIIDTFISEKDSGIYNAMNKGVRFAKGKFILFLGADDKLVINLDELYQLNLDEQFVYYGDVILSNSNKIYCGRFNTAKLLNKNICHQSIFYPRNLFDEFQFGIQYKLMEDYVMNLKLWSSKKYKFIYLKKVIAVYNTNGQSSTIHDLEFKKDIWKIVYQHFGFTGIIIKIFNPLRNFFN